MNGLDIRAERKWMESHPGQVLDEVRDCSLRNTLIRSLANGLWHWKNRYAQLPQYSVRSSITLSTESMCGRFSFLRDAYW